MFDDIIYFIVKGKQNHYVSHEDLFALSAMKKTVDLLIKNTSGNESILNIVKCLLSMDRCNTYQASHVLKMLQVNKLLEEYVPTEYELESHYQTSLLQLHYQVSYYLLYFFSSYFYLSFFLFVEFCH
jgi:hypothetical protein